MANKNNDNEGINIKKGRQISEDNIKFLINLHEHDINLPLLVDLFAFTKNKQPQFLTNDFFILPVKTLYNDKPEATNVGRFIFNKLILNDKLGEIFGYINKPISNKVLNELLTKLDDAMLEDKINANDYSEFLDKADWLGFSITKFLAPSCNYSSLHCPEEITNLKKKLFEDNKKEIEERNPEVVSKIESELINASKSYTEGNSSLTIYESGSRGSYSNNYKNTSLIRGVMKDFVDGTYHISSSSLEEGFNPEEFHEYANLAISGEFSRSVDTKNGGYEFKKLNSAFQTVKIQEHGSDCHSTQYIEILLTEDNFSLFKNRYIKENSSLVLLTNDNKSKYVNKLVKFRSPMFCKDSDLCNKCVGETPYKIGIKYLGLTTSAIGSAINNRAMKKFHDTTIKVREINIEDYIE